MTEQPLLIAGPCVIESLERCREICAFAKEKAKDYGFHYIFKASFDKANRTSVQSFRGPGIKDGLAILKQIKEEFNVEILTDVHLPEHIHACAAGRKRNGGQNASNDGSIVDYIQIPAFLCRQTDLIKAAAESGLKTNIKKGQFLAHGAMRFIKEKYYAFGGKELLLTERGNTFGYGHLVVDMVGINTLIAQNPEAKIIIDATHSAQQPSSGATTSGNRENAMIIAKSASALGIHGIFAEVHPDPNNALSDAANTLSFDMFDKMLKECSQIMATVQNF